LDKRKAPQAIDCHLLCIRGFYDYRYYEEGLPLTNSVKKGSNLKLPSPLPRYLKEEEILKFFSVVTHQRITPCLG
jgi:site-specific recombinase XerD